MNDWREDYIICEHVEKDSPTNSLRHQGYRVCCEDCFKSGFLIKELECLAVPDYYNQLSIAKIKH